MITITHRNVKIKPDNIFLSKYFPFSGIFVAAGAESSSNPPICSYPEREHASEKCSVRVPVHQYFPDDIDRDHQKSQTGADHPGAERQRLHIEDFAAERDEEILEDQNGSHDTDEICVSSQPFEGGCLPRLQRPFTVFLQTLRL